MKALVALALLVPALALAEDPAPAAASPAAPPPTPPTPGTPAPTPVEWKGTVGAGLIVLSGNSDTTTFTASVAASRETFGWITSVKATVAYGENRAAGAPATEVSANSASGQLRLDRKLGQVWSVFAIGGIEADHVANIEYRSAAELGGAAQLIERQEADWPRLTLRADLGFRYGYEARYQYYGSPIGPQPGVEILAPRAGLAFRYGFSKEVFLTEETEAMTTLTGEGRWLAKTVTKLSSRLGKAFTFGAGYTVAYDSRPAEGKETTDQALTALLEVGF